MVNTPEEYHPVLICFEKEINTRKDATKASKTVRSNVIIFVPDSTVKKFNIPVYTGDIPRHTFKSEHTRKRLGSKVYNVREYRPTRRTSSRYTRKVKIINGNNFYYINFPMAFTIHMIRDALYLLLKKNKTLSKFQVLPSQKKRDIYIGNKNTVKVFLPPNGRLIQAVNIDDAKFGAVIIIDNIPLKQKKAVPI